MIVDNNLIYKTIKSPRYVRRSILNTGINLIELMQKQNKIKKIREEKRKVMLMLEEEIKNTNTLLDQFHELIPKAKIQKTKTVKPKQKKVILKPKRKIEITPSKPSKLDSLHQELFNLKAKLDNI